MKCYLPETPRDFDEVIKRFNYLVGIMFTELSELSPEVHKKVMMKCFPKTEQGKPGGQQPKMLLDASREEITSLPLLYHHCAEINDFMEFDNVVLPKIIDAVIIERLTEKNAFVNIHKRQSIRRNLLVKIREKLRSHKLRLHKSVT